MRYPITCKKIVSGVKVTHDGFPKMMTIDEALATTFDLDCEVDLIGVRGVRLYFKNPGDVELTAGERPS